MLKPFWLNAFLAIVVLSICVQIELLNHAADSYLPRKDSGKWRQSFFLSEEMWRQYYNSKMGDEALLNRPLTADERNQMQKDVSYAKDKNALLGMVSSFGLLQYILAPLSLIWSFTIAKRNANIAKRILSALFVISNFISIVLMVYRGYFTSLGW